MKNLFGHSSSIGREELWENITASIDQLWSTSASVTKTMELYTSVGFSVCFINWNFLVTHRYVYEYVVAAKVLHIGITLEDFDMHLKQYIQSKLNQLLQVCTPSSFRLSEKFALSKMSWTTVFPNSFSSWRARLTLVKTYELDDLAASHVFEKFVRYLDVRRGAQSHGLALGMDCPVFIENRYCSVLNVGESC